MTRFLCLVTLLCGLASLPGCGNNPPMKTGGGGMQQPYSGGNGQYIPKR